MKSWNATADVLRGIEGLEVRESEPMSRHTTLMIGGPVDLFVTWESPEALISALSILKAAGCPHLAAGAGSNLLVTDDGLEGAILVPGQGMSFIMFPDDEVSVCATQEILAGAGTNIGVLLAALCRRDLSGLEYLTGIPGTVGGAVAMNAGTRYGYVDSSLVSVQTVSAGGRHTLSASELNLGYRTSAIPSDHVLVSAVFRVIRGRGPEAEDVARCLSEIRKNNHPPASGTAGSFFRNPDPSRGLFAGQLIEECGLKGLKVGGAVVSPRHANFLMNGGGASAADLLNLAVMVRDRVRSEKGVELVREVRVVGRSADCWTAKLP